MRIRFAPPDTREAALVRELEARADAFFGEAVANLREAMEYPVLRGRLDLERRLAPPLACVAPGLLVEVDVCDGGIEVALTPAEDSGLEPLLDTVLGRAPTAPGLRFVRHRSERNVAAAVSEVRERFELDLSGARLRIGFSRGHLLEVVVHSSAFSSAADAAGLDAANVLALRLVGDELFDDWIGAVDVIPAPKGALRVLSPARADATLSLADALPSVEAALRGAYAELPDAPYRIVSERAKWTLFEANPGAELDYPEQDDIALASTLIPEAMKCFLERSRFSSKRFSKHGECFAYVKVDATRESADERHALRVGLEEALGRALLAAKIGCVVGAGLGVRYVYVDVALENVTRGVELVRDVLRRLRVHPRSWILFCDATLSREWVGVWDDTPPPPMR